MAKRGSSSSGKGKSSGKQKMSRPAAGADKAAAPVAAPKPGPAATVGAPVPAAPKAEQARSVEPLPAPAIPYSAALHRRGGPDAGEQAKGEAPKAEVTPRQPIQIPREPAETHPAPPKMPAPASLPPTIAAPAAELAPAPQPVLDLAAPTRRAGENTLSSAMQQMPQAPSAPSAPASGEGGGAPQPLLFEIAWEVCWQLGGIYTVLRSKAAAMVARWGDRYCLVGPYNPATAALEFEEQAPDGIVRDALNRMRDMGMPCHYGRWLVAGRPRVILVDYRARFNQMDSDKYYLWKDHGISTPPSDGEVNEVISFGFTVAELFRSLAIHAGERPILAHFHEWMGGLAVPRIAHMQLPVATVFTTHATLLGRYLASNNPDFYRHLPFTDPDKEAAHFNIFSRYQIERAATHASTVFTTVSEVTAREADRLLGRQADVILPNGLNIQRFAALHEFQNLHRQYKERIHEFVMGHFFPSYSFDLDKTIYLFTSGRYEYRNKGMDLFIEALQRLNWRLRELPDRPTVVAFIITRAQTRNINVSVLQNHSMFEDLRNTCDDLKEQMGQRLFLSAVRGRIPSFNEMMTDDAHVRLKRAIHAWRSGRQPVIVTHDLVDDANDPVLKHLRHRGLFNAPDDPVKVIFHPDFVTATLPTLSMDYEQFVRGCHVGIFPSYYEPWGYTPMESVALGLPAVTTDLSGFGAYVQRHIPDAEQQGILVLNRANASFDQSTDQLVNYLYNFAQLNRRQRIELRNRVERLSELFDWSHLVSHYHEAHDLALERRGAKRLGTIDVRLV